MLNIPSITPPRLPPPHAIPPPKRRGAQPSNRNAYKHGIFALHHPTIYSSLLPFKKSIPRPSSFSSVSLADTVHALQRDVERMLIASKTARNLHEYLAWVNRIVSAVGHVARMKLFASYFVQHTDHLRFIAAHALDLIHLDFHQNGITRDADSFRENGELSDFNSPPGGGASPSTLPSFADPFLSPQQWSLLEPLLPPEERTGQRGRPPADPRFLLDAAFWKLAHYAHWQDLPSRYPPMLTCRRYYRRLYLSGRLATLYRALYRDLLSCGGVDLLDWVEQDRFILLDNQVILHPAVPDSWQARTVLLFMQQAFQAFRRQRVPPPAFLHPRNIVE